MIFKIEPKKKKKKRERERKEHHFACDFWSNTFDDKRRNEVYKNPFLQNQGKCINLQRKNIIDIIQVI